MVDRLQKWYVYVSLILFCKTGHVVLDTLSFVENLLLCKNDDFFGIYGGKQIKFDGESPRSIFEKKNKNSSHLRFVDAVPWIDQMSHQTSSFEWEIQFSFYASFFFWWSEQFKKKFKEIK